MTIILVRYQRLIALPRAILISVELFIATARKKVVFSLSRGTVVSYLRVVYRGPLDTGDCPRDDYRIYTSTSFA